MLPLLCLRRFLPQAAEALDQNTVPYVSRQYHPQPRDPFSDLLGGRIGGIQAQGVRASTIGMERGARDKRHMLGKRLWQDLSCIAAPGKRHPEEHPP